MVIDSDDRIGDSLKTADIILMVGQDLTAFKYAGYLGAALKAA